MKTSLAIVVLFVLLAFGTEALVRYAIVVRDYNNTRYVSVQPTYTLAPTLSNSQSGFASPYTIYKVNLITQESAAAGTSNVAGSGHGGHGFNYDDPAHWKDSFPACGGRRQSPIDFTPAKMRSDTTLRPIKFFNYWNTPKDMVVQNNLHSIELSATWPDLASTPCVTDGPFYSLYCFKQLHMHWGLNNSWGSEHTIKGHRFPMEMHVVHWNTAYPSFEVASTKPDGLAVLAYFFTISQANVVLEYLKRYASSIEGSKAKEMEIQTPFPLGALNVGIMNDRYMTYEGSLTTPPCSEVVTWAVAATPLTVSDAQLAFYRDVVKDAKHKDFPNYRGTQPLNGREVRMYL